MNDPANWAAVITALAGLVTGIGALWHSTNTRTKLNDHKEAVATKPAINITPEDVSAVALLIISVREAITPKGNS